MVETYYKVKLQIFEGPLDLLLYLIRKNELDIYNIPIAEITEQYIEYLNLMKTLDLDIAGEFLVMAATLLQIKSSAMLPSGAVGEYDEPMLTREELMRQLLEYKKFKDAATELLLKEELKRDLYNRLFIEPEFQNFNLKEFRFEATLFDLLSAFRKILQSIPEEQLTAFQEETVTVDQKMDAILKLLSERRRIEFSSLFPEICTRFELIVTFLAILELVRLRKIIARQSQLFGKIWLYNLHQKSSGQDG